jgi:hypothetical protein
MRSASLTSRLRALLASISSKFINKKPCRVRAQAEIDYNRIAQTEQVSKSLTLAVVSEDAGGVTADQGQIQSTGIQLVGQGSQMLVIDFKESSGQ